MGHYELLVYVDHVNLLRDNIDTTNKNTKTSTEASKEVDLKLNIEITKYILVSHYQNVDKIQDKKIANR
jgi:hypothetical protein